MMSSLIPSALMLAAGFGIPIMAALNAGLGSQINSPIAAAFVLFLVGFSVVAVAMAMTGLPSRAALAATQPQYFAGGLLVAFYILSITWSAPRIGVGNAIFLVLLGQLAAAAIIDHYGLFGAPETPISLRRVAGLLLMAIGVFLARKEI